MKGNKKLYQPGFQTHEDQDTQPLAESSYQSPVKVHYMTGYDSQEQVDEKELAEIRQQLHYTTSVKKSKPKLHMIPLSDYAEETYEKPTERLPEEPSKSVIEGIQQHKGLSQSLRFGSCKNEKKKDSIFETRRNNLRTKVQKSLVIKKYDGESAVSSFSEID